MHVFILHVVTFDPNVTFRYLINPFSSIANIIFCMSLVPAPSHTYIVVLHGIASTILSLTNVTVDMCNKFVTLTIESKKRVKCGACISTWIVNNMNRDLTSAAHKLFKNGLVTPAG